MKAAEKFWIYGFIVFHYFQSRTNSFGDIVLSFKAHTNFGHWFYFWSFRMSLDLFMRVFKF